jgi:hypothetical protein
MSKVEQVLFEITLSTGKFRLFMENTGPFFEAGPIK